MSNDDADYSDLTDMEDDEDETLDTTGGQSKGKGKKTNGEVKEGYSLKRVLNVPRATTYTAQALYEQIISEDVDLNPEYQRDVVWGAQKQIGIIDSIFRNFYIPPVIFAVNTGQDGSETKTCIDGKQRLTSIARFMDGLIPHRDPLTNEKLWFKIHKKNQAEKRKLLPDKMKKLFANKQIVCVEYHKISDEDEREIFQRVQLGMALTPSEKLQVVKSPRADFIREIQDTWLSEDGALNGEELKWDTKRGQAFRCLCMVSFWIDRTLSNPRRAKTASGFSTLTAVEKWLADSSVPSDAFYDKLRSVYAIFSHLIQDPDTSQIIVSGARKLAPIEFVGCSVLIATYMDKMTLSQLARSIAEMRKNVREKHKDVRMNSAVAKSLMDCVQSIGKKRTDCEKANSAQAIVKVPPRVPRPAQNKRKRVKEDEDELDEDEDDEESPSVQPRVFNKRKVKKRSASPGFDTQGDADGSGSKSEPTPPRESSRLAGIRAAKAQAAARSDQSAISVGLSTAQFGSIPVPSASPLSLTSNSFGQLPPQSTATNGFASSVPPLNPALYRSSFSSNTSSTPPISPQVSASQFESSLMSQVGMAGNSPITTSSTPQYNPNQPSFQTPNYAPRAEAHPIQASQPSPHQATPIAIPLPFSGTDQHANTRRYDDRYGDRRSSGSGHPPPPWDRDRDRDRGYDRSWDSREWDNKSSDRRRWSGFSQNGVSDSGWQNRNGHGR